MVGGLYSKGASGARSGVVVVAGCTAIEEYTGTSTEDMDDAGSHDGRCSPSGTCAPFWKYGTIGTVQLAKYSTTQTRQSSSVWRMPKLPALTKSAKTAVKLRTSIEPAACMTARGSMRKIDVSRTYDS